jgi:hypothetical protein
MTLQNFLVSRNTSDVIAVPYCINSGISIPFLSLKTVAISYLAGRRLFKLFGIVW